MMVFLEDVMVFYAYAGVYHLSCAYTVLMQLEGSTMRYLSKNLYLRRVKVLWIRYFVIFS